ncbi:MAG: NAD(P)-dependent oxidoreductase [Bacilli bacterium]|jgi:nucleoside-diphosphate-sugar epimerase|nr:NAD(P)-dependent oxidoreductase [Bacilli bacterium]
MKAIVTGANGFIGSNLIKNLLNHGYQVLAIDVCEKPKRIDLSNSGIIYYQHSVEDISFLTKVVSHGEYPLFFHFAWRGSAGSERGDEKIQLDNVSQAVKCLRTAAEIGVEKFVFSSSIAELETKRLIYQDGTAPDPHFIYGAAKAACHEIMKPIANSIGIGLVWTYITNSYGVGDPTVRFLNTTLRKMIHGENISFTSGIQNYDFVYIDDVINAFRLIGEKGVPNKAYLIGSGEAKPLRDFLQDVIDIVKPSSEISFGNVPYTGVQTPLEAFSIDSISRDCGFAPLVSFRKGIKLVYDWLKETEK